MSKHDIIAALAADKEVERIVRNVAKRSLSASLLDLCQEIYLSLLQLDEDKVVKMYEGGAIFFYIARMATNQYFSSSSGYNRNYRKKAAYDGPNAGIIYDRPPED